MDVFYISMNITILGDSSTCWKLLLGWHTYHWWALENGTVRRVILFLVVSVLYLPNLIKFLHSGGTFLHMVSRLISKGNITMVKQIIR